MPSGKFLLRSAFRGFFCGSLLFGPSARERVGQTVISLVTGVLEDRTCRLLPRHLRRPGSCPGRRIVDRELIADAVLVHAREALGQPHALARALERELVREVRRVNDQCLTLPMTAVAPGPLPNAWRQMRTSVQRNDANVVEHLGENHHVSRSLHNLVIVVVGAAQHGRSVVVHQDTARAERLVLYRIVGPASALSRGCTLSGSPPALR